MATIERYETKSGTTLYRVRYRTPEGRQTDKRGFDTKREAQQWATTVEASKLAGRYVAPSGGRVTVGELGPAWLARQGHVKPSGFRSYESGWARHVRPRWGDIRLVNIRHSDVQAWVSQLSARRGPSVVRCAHGVLARILDDCVKDGMLAANVARGVKLPPKGQRRHIYLTAEQLDRLADASGQYQSLVLLLGTVGLRWGEVAGLTVADVDFLRRRIELHRNAVTVAGRVIWGTLKTHRGRTVVVPRFVIDALAVTAAGKGRDDLLWSTETGGALSPPGPKSWLADAVLHCQASDPGFPRVTAHALRHTAASLAISSGANVKAVQRMLGHSSAAMTLDVYADLFEADLDAVAENMGRMWARASESS